MMFVLRIHFDLPRAADFILLYSMTFKSVQTDGYNPVCSDVARRDGSSRQVHNR